VGQAFSSAANFALMVLAGRLLGPGGLGVVVIGYAAYQLVASLQRAIVTQPLIADAASRPASERRHLARSGLTLVATTGLAAAAGLGLTGFLIGGNVGRGLLIFSPWLVGGLLQEFWKAFLFQEGRGAEGAASDCIRLLAMLAGLPIVLAWRNDFVVVGLWGAALVVGLIVAAWRLPARPAPPAALGSAFRQGTWLLGRWLGAREIIFQLLTYATVLILAAVIGTKGLGGLRSAEALFSPFSLIAAALVLPALPALSRAVVASRSGARRLALQLSGLSLSFGLVYFVVMAFFGPWLLVRLFGSSFSRFESLVWPMAATQLFNAAAFSFTVLLSAEKRGPASLVAGTITSTAVLGCATLLASTNGVVGAAWGIAAGSAIGSATTILFGLGWSERGRPPRGQVL
jgi:O-antigen/teichoic acid export membrane protein